MPAITLVRDAALKTKYKSNLRQLGLASMGYSFDWEGYALPMRVWDGTSWLDLINDYLDKSLAGSSSYVNATPKWECPAWPRHVLFPITGIAPSYAIYPFPLAENSWDYSKPNFTFTDLWSGAKYPYASGLVHAASVNHPSAHAQFWDSHDWTTYGLTPFGWHPDPRYLVPRHRGPGNTNIQFHDGHVASLDSDRIGSTGIGFWHFELE